MLQNFQKGHLDGRWLDSVSLMIRAWGVPFRVSTHPSQQPCVWRLWHQRLLFFGELFLCFRYPIRHGFAPGSLMVLNYEISLLSSSANLSDDGCSRSGTSRHPLSPSPSLRFPLWAALAVQRWMSMSPKDMWFQMSVDVTRTYLKFIQFKVSIPTAATFITFDGHAIICSPQEVLLSTSCK